MNATLGRALVCAAAAVSALPALAQMKAQDHEPASRFARMAGAPQFRVDAQWPQPLPNQWLLGQVAGVAVDRHDTIWIIQRPLSLTADEAGAAQTPPRSNCCVPAPSVMRFDQDGRLLMAWAGRRTRVSSPSAARRPRAASGRPTNTASSSTTTTTSGSPATAAATTRC